MRSDVMKRYAPLGLALMLAACGPDEPASSGWTISEAPGDETDYGEGDVVVLPGATGEENGSYVITGDGEDACVQIDDQTCVALDDAKDQYCDDEDAQADIILDEAGEVVEVVCYPPESSGVPVEEVAVNEDGVVQVPQDANGAVITFAEATDGEPIEGDVRLDAERTTIFGNGVEETIIDGDLTLASNNSRVRGVAITGDVMVAGNSNNAAITFCKISGSLEVTSNGFSLVNTIVFGDVTVSGNEARLVNVGVQGEWDVNPRSHCEGCYSFSDEDEDGTLADEEVGDPLSCDPSS